MTFPTSKLESLQAYDWIWNRRERVEVEHSPDDLVQCGYCGEVCYREDLSIDNEFETMCSDCSEEEAGYFTQGGENDQDRM